MPQDSPFNVRGARNLPCYDRPGKRAPTVKMCESDEEYVPLNDGYNWKGDPNATLSGQAIPQLPPGSPPAQAASGTPRVRAAAADRGRRIRPGHRHLRGTGRAGYTQSNLAPERTKEQTWQTMLVPPTGS